SIARLVQVATFALLIAGMSKPALAQVDSYRFGYQFLHSTCDGCDGTNVPLGFYGDVAGKIAPLPMLDWVGQATFGHKSQNDVSNNLFTVGGGVRYAFAPKSSSIIPHAQGLILIAHQSTGDVTIAGKTFSGSSTTKAGIELSAAVDAPLSNGWIVTGAAGI